MEPTFNLDGSYDLRTEKKQLAAALAALRSIAVVRFVYVSRGAEYCRDEMARIASETERSISEARR